MYCKIALCISFTLTLATVINYSKVFKLFMFDEITLMRIITADFTLPIWSVHVYKLGVFDKLYIHIDNSRNSMAVQGFGMSMSSIFIIYSYSQWSQLYGSPSVWNVYE